VNERPLAPSPIYRAQILKVASAIGVLGGGPNSAPRLMAALCDPDVDGAQVMLLLRDQPALCARVLRVANSALYGRVQAVKSLAQALTVIGLDAVRGVAAAACLDRTLLRGESSLLDLRAVLSHSQATAAAADSLARCRFPDLAADAFISGLLHNLGTIVQIHVDPEGVKALLAARRAGDERDLAVLEAELGAVSHEECGAVIFEAWGFPRALISTARFHHRPLRAPETDRRLTALIHVGSALALASGSPLTLEPTSTWAPANREALECLGLDEKQLDEAAAAIADRMAELKQVLRAA
jgi:HD-like signal output (HDOD) protein